MLDNIRIVLVNPSHPGNIGAAARAMKVMGLRHLTLVDPVDFPSDEAVSRASGADDILENARVALTLTQALENSHFVMGTTARERNLSAHVVYPNEMVQQLQTKLAFYTQQGTVPEFALVFGRERTGLTNEEVDQCQLLVNIPTSDTYRSLNLGAAVQVLSYELRRSQIDTTMHTQSKSSDRLGDNADAAKQHPLDMPADYATRSHFYEHLERWMTQVHFLDKTNPVLIMRRLRGLFDRAQPTQRELNIVRGAISATEKQLGQSTLPREKDKNNDEVH